MCRYAMSGPYKRHYVCFSCRKQFKQPPIEDYLESRGLGYVYTKLQQVAWYQPSLELREKELGRNLADIEAKYRDAIVRCPECGNQMIDMGLDFKPPKQSDAKAWQTLQGMYRVGHAFHTCGCNGPGWIPRSTSDFRNYLAATKKQYEGQLELIRVSSTLSTEEKKARAEYWSSRIEAIDREQLNVG